MLELEDSLLQHNITPVHPESSELEKDIEVHIFHLSHADDTLGVGARCSSVVRAFAHDAMGRRIDPSWGGPIELFLVPASAPRLV